MGRQIAVAMEHEDEEAFLTFLHESGRIALYRSWSPTATPVASFASEMAASPFYVHNRAFQWQPQFERVEYTDRVSGQPGTYFRLNTRHAPILEYSRHPLGAIDPQVSGRIYWSKLVVSQPHELMYDVAAFDRWFTLVVRWVRKHAKRLPHGNTEPWCLPAAMRRLQIEP